MVLRRHSLKTALSLFGTLVTCTAAIAPSLVTLSNTTQFGCDIHITTQVSSNQSSIDLFFDTTKSNGTTPDVLAWTDSVSETSSECVVCTTVKWTDKLYGQIMSLDYDFYHQMDLGLLEGITTHIWRNAVGDPSEEWFETSYIYGSEDSLNTSHVYTNLPNSGGALALDYAKDGGETLCIQTYFGVYNRIGVTGSKGEISRKSIFKQSVNLEWQVEKPVASPPV